MSKRSRQLAMTGLLAALTTFGSMGSAAAGRAIGVGSSSVPAYSYRGHRVYRASPPHRAYRAYSYPAYSNRRYYGPRYAYPAYHYPRYAYPAYGYHVYPSAPYVPSYSYPAYRYQVYPYAPYAPYPYYPPVYGPYGARPGIPYAYPSGYLSFGPYGGFGVTLHFGF